jgi:DNA processing protein
VSAPDPRGAKFAAALAALPGMGPATLVRILSIYTPEEAWGAVRAGRVVRPERRRVDPGGGTGPAVPVAPTLPWDGRDAPVPPGPAQGRMPWTVASRRADPKAADVARCAAGIGITWWGNDRYPAALAVDPEPPGVLFWRGDLDWLDRPTVALVGTRKCTPDGRATAFELGRDLAAAGVCVVSGLALGSEGAAHAGALAMDGAGTVGVAASGVDVVYPPSHDGLWARVVGHGAVCSETPPGRPAQAWRFPARNRVIAGLSRLVVVVESHSSGGSLITVEAALRRGIEVRAVPGPVRSPASAGSNQLLADGPAPVRHAGDVLDALGSIGPWPPAGMHLRPRRLRPGPFLRSRPSAGPGPGRGCSDPVTAGSATAGSATAGSATAGSATAGSVATGPTAHLPIDAVLAAVGWRPSTLNQVVQASGLPVAVVDAALDALVEQGLVAVDSSWWSRVG